MKVFEVISQDPAAPDCVRAYGKSQVEEIARSFGPGTYEVVEVHRLFGRDNETSDWGTATVDRDGRVELAPHED